MYLWIVLLHVAGAFLFVLSHGVSAWVVNAIRRETSVARISALASLSQASLGGAYVGLLALLVGGIWAGIAGNWFRFAWIWVALAVFILVAIGMYMTATRFFVRLRTALGVRNQGVPKDAPDPTPATDGEILAIAASAPAMALNGIGFGGLLIILWLMVVKPF